MSITSDIALINKIVPVAQGDTTTALKPRPGSLGEAETIDGTWACHTKVLSPSGTALIDRAITEKTSDSMRFVVSLTPAETAALAVETYTWIIELSNTTTVPPYNVEVNYTLAVEPQYDPSTDSSQLVIERGVNSFSTYEHLLRSLQALPNLYAANNTTRPMLKAVFIQSWFDIGALVVDFDNGICTTRYFDADILDALTDQQRNDLIRAQLQQADYIQTAHPGQRDATVRRITSGDATTVYRNNRAVIVCAEATRTLSPYMVPGQSHTATIHP